MASICHTADMAKPTTYPFKSVVALTDEMVAAIDEWRRNERDLPPRAEAIRRLIDLGLTATRKGAVKGSTNDAAG